MDFVGERCRETRRVAPARAAVTYSDEEALVERDGAARIGGTDRRRAHVLGLPCQVSVSTSGCLWQGQDPAVQRAVDRPSSHRPPVSASPPTQCRRSPQLSGIALYRSYLYLIMLIETVPRATGEEHVTWVREAVAPQLTAALDELGG